MRNDHLWAAERGTEGQRDVLSRRGKMWNNWFRTIISHKILCLAKHIKGCVFSSKMCAPFPSLGVQPFPVVVAALPQPVTHSVSPNWWLLLTLWLPAPPGFISASSLWSQCPQLLSSTQDTLVFGSHCWIRPMELLPWLISSSLAPGYQSGDGVKGLWCSWREQCMWQMHWQLEGRVGNRRGFTRKGAEK